eukprot:scaffold83281_cov36-Tisochrysis_lutea.AAC.2
MQADGPEKVHPAIAQPGRNAGQNQRPRQPTLIASEALMRSDGQWGASLNSPVEDLVALVRAWHKAQFEPGAWPRRAQASSLAQPHSIQEHKA